MQQQLGAAYMDTMHGCMRSPRQDQRVQEEDVGRTHEEHTARTELAPERGATLVDCMHNGSMHSSCHQLINSRSLKVKSAPNSTDEQRA